ncbi:MAG: hypothetical protein OXI87_17465 [Albidovulum sp.]|nr:hypothetical protein [Albidovulum sp.]
MANGIGDRNPAFKAAGCRILVPVLESLQLLSVADPEAGGTGLHMDIAHMPGAIGKTSNGVQ